jgi:hypothetical protein
VRSCAVAPPPTRCALPPLSSEPKESSCGLRGTCARCYKKTMEYAIAWCYNKTLGERGDALAHLHESAQTTPHVEQSRRWHIPAQSVTYFMCGSRGGGEVWGKGYGLSSACTLKSSDFSVSIHCSSICRVISEHLCAKASNLASQSANCYELLPREQHVAHLLPAHLPPARDARAARLCRAAAEPGTRPLCNGFKVLRR